MSEKSKPKIELTGPGLSLKREISEDLAREVILLVLGAGQSLRVGGTDRTTNERQLTPPSNVRTGSGEIRISERTTIRDLMDQTQAHRSPEKITCIAYHIKYVQKAAEFSAAILMKGFSDAGEPVPGNLSRDIAWTKKHGWIAPILGKSRSYAITNSGEKALLAKFPADTQKSLGRTKKKPAK